MVKKRGGREGRDTGTSHELNRTANSSTREVGASGRGQGGGVEERAGGQIAFTLHYAHIHTHKRNGTQVAFPVKVAPKERLCCPFPAVGSSSSQP